MMTMAIRCMWGETLGGSSSITSKEIDSIVLSLVVNR